MVSIAHELTTNHEELIHDSQADFYGSRLATCSSDSKIKIFELNGRDSKQLAELNGHEGPVWQLDWSHPEHGNLLASCSFDRKAIIWKETNGKWEKFKEHKEHDSSVNSVRWAPREFGLMLACASADQSISILKYREEDNDWESRKIPNAHTQGVNAVSWAPPISSVSTVYRPNVNINTNVTSGPASGRGGQQQQPGGVTLQNMSTTASISGDTATMLSKPNLVIRLVSGGCDSLVKIWKYDRERDEWSIERELVAHTDWVRDVAWAPSIGLPKWYIASCSQDKKVIIWTNAEGPNGPNGNEWESKILCDFNDVVWHVSWSIMGNILAVSCGENRVSLWKEDMSGDFRCISGQSKQI